LSKSARVVARLRSALGRGAAPVAGAVELVSNHQIYGWAADPDDAQACVRVEIRLDGVPIGTTEAGLFRPDLAAASRGHGRHGFDVKFPRMLQDAELGRIEAVLPELGIALPVLPGAIRTLDLPRAPDPQAAADPRIPRFRSRFGGIWTDLSNAPALLDGKRELGLVSAEEHTLLAGWIADGYAILPGAIPPELCDRVLEDAERAFAGELGLLYREIGTAEGVRLVEAAGARAGKLIDLYVKSQAALDIIVHARIARFLSLVFDRPALVFQSLYFEYGSQQRLHQDTAFVPVSSPLQLAASWTALEDVQPGSGELVYAPGSQAIDEFLFDGQYRLMPPGSREEEAFHLHLERSVAARGQPLVPFLPRKGDVLLWSADLAHGGATITAPEPLPTRRSLVAHYCPLDCRPGYFDAATSQIVRQSPMAASTFAARPY
jgi:hypothetical protein